MPEFEVDVTRPSLDARYLVGLFIVVIVALLIWQFASGIVGMVTTQIKPATSEPVGTLQEGFKIEQKKRSG